MTAKEAGKPADTGQRRVVSLWLPRFATDRLSSAARDAPARPLATAAGDGRGRVVAAVDAMAEAAGVVPGLPLASARALLPGLRTVAADPTGDRRALAGLALWCGRYTPWAAADATGGVSGAGLWLDVTGAAHLFGGEEALLGDLAQRIAGFGFAVRATLADTPGAAWAGARFGDHGRGGFTVVPVGGSARALAPLPVAALRLSAATIEGLRRLGLRCVGDLMKLPRGPLVARFGGEIARRLDQALGQAPEPLFPRRPRPTLRVRMAFAEPIGTREDVALAAHRLIAAACDRLAQAHEGARRLELTAFRADGTTARATVGTGRPVRDPRHLERLFTEKLDTVDAGFGIDAMVLAVTAADPLAPEQAGLDAGKHGRDGADSGLARLIDRLGNRLGAAGVRAIVPRASHVPERAWRAVAMLPERPGNPPTDAAMAGRPEDARRPIHLLAPPEPIDAVAPVPDGPPAAFRWRRRQHRVARAEGPERIGPEWWTDRSEILHQGEMRRRDYYRIEDDAGGRFWVFREGPYRPGIRPKWYLHGLFP